MGNPLRFLLIYFFSTSAKNAIGTLTGIAPNLWAALSLFMCDVYVYFSVCHWELN